VTVDPRTEIPDARIIRALWIGLLLPPLAFLFNLELAYALVPVACSSRNVLPIHLVHLVSLLLVAAAGVLAWREWRRSGATWPDGEPGSIGRTRFLSGMGLLLSLQFTLVILAQWIPSFVLDPCQ
jgi:hypothetical protein